MSRSVKRRSFESEQIEIERTAVQLNRGRPLKKVNPNFKLPDKAKQWVGRKTALPRIAFSSIKSPGLPVYNPPPVYSVPKHQVKIRALTSDGKPITDFIVSTNTPNISNYNVREKIIFKTDRHGEISVLALSLIHI